MTKLEKKQEVIEKQLDFLDIEKIREYTKCKWMAKEVVLLEETDSTNVEAARLAQQGRNHGTVVIADRQTCGKGRRGRSWHTPGNTSIAMSFLLKPQLEAEYASMLTLVQAMAVAEAVEEVTALKSQIKWPNDILINEKKVCGILTEMNLSGNEISSIIIGTGINVNQESFPEEIREIATSLKNESGKAQCREKLIGALCEKFEQYYEQFLTTKDLSCIIEEYNARLVSVGRSVRVLDPKGEYTGEAIGINAQGELQVRQDDGEIINVYAGEVSVRGIYGYV